MSVEEGFASGGDGGGSSCGGGEGSNGFDFVIGVIIIGLAVAFGV